MDRKEEGEERNGEERRKRKASKVFHHIFPTHSKTMNSIQIPTIFRFIPMQIQVLNIIR